ncbi:cyclin-like protein [Aspergillus falconensis]
MASEPPVKRPPPAPSNPVLLAAQKQWLFTVEELSRSPSQLDGMTVEVENLNRSKGVNFITQVGIMLKLPQPTLATAAVYLHRFFMRYAIGDKPERPGVHPYPIAATSLFLATKVEENVRRMKELVIAVCRVAQKKPDLVVDEQSKEFWKWRDTILHHEDILLEALCFDLQLEQPYRILYDYICFFGVNDNKHIRNSSWAFLNDSMYTVLCLQFPARVIAAAAFYAAASHCDIAFEDDELGRSWWEQIDVDITQVRHACTRMAELYESNSQHRHSQYYPPVPIAWKEGAEKTRIPRPGSSLDAPPDPGSRKRSWEPEDNSKSGQQPSQDTASEKPGGAPQNGARSPKRPRVGSDADKPRSVAGSFASSSTLPQGGDGTHPRPPSSYSPAAPPSSSSSSSSSTFSQDRPPNGHHAHQPHRYQHPLPPAPRTTFPPRRNSENRNVDPIQQRIDQIVQQNSAPPKRGPDRYGEPDRERDRDREDEDGYQRRRPSYSSSTRNEHPPPPPPEHRQQPSPPPPPEPEPDDEGGGSEEGEL